MFKFKIFVQKLYIVWNIFYISFDNLFSYLTPEILLTINIILLFK